MRKFYKVFLLIIVLVFLTTYTPSKFEKNLKNNNTFFKIQKIVILNNLLVKEEDILSKIDLLYGKNIFLIKGKDIKKSLENLNFLKKIEVKKKYPDTIIVKIFETKPVGILLKDKKQYLLDSSSNLIEMDKKMDFAGLPSIIGDDAEKNIINFLAQLEKNNFPTKNIKFFFYFKVGRWDLKLLDSRLIKLPYNVNSSIIKKTIDLLSRKDFQKYKIIDLRIDDKIIVE